ncbi:MAG: phosphoglycerate kinase [Elusimicrobiales bacterium]|nr:phosphoglycerate kinase [Elusimicrobiales bacterium]
MSMQEKTKGRLVPLNTWGAITAQLRAIKEEKDSEKQIAFLIEAIVNLRLLDKERDLPDKRDEKGNIDEFYAMLLDEAVKMLDSVPQPSVEFTYYSRELLKKLPLREGGTDLIGDLRSAAEQFDESRTDDDPLRGFAADLRKEVHRRLSPRILTRYIEPYFALLDGNKKPMMRAGYAGAAMQFNPEEEDTEYTQLAEEMRDKLTYLWDYGHGNISRLKENITNRMDLFEKCFLRKEIEGFLKLCEPHEIRMTHNLEDCLQRLINFKKLIRACFLEGRISHIDYLNTDLDLGRFIFLFTNDLTNNHYSHITYSNFKDCIALSRDLVNLMNAKGILSQEAGADFSKKLNCLYEAASPDFLQARQIFQDLSSELQKFLKNGIFHNFTPMLNSVLDKVYHVPTASIAAIRDRFFNSFIRTTEFHAVNAFIEKILDFLLMELSAKSTESSLYGRYSFNVLPEVNGNFEKFIACTWKPVSGEIRPFLGGKGNGIIDMSSLGVKVPPAFILGLPVCEELSHPEADTKTFRMAVADYLNQLEEQTGRKLGSPDRPLLVSTRSGATISMPGSMCTILNVGLTPAVRARLSEKYGRAFAETLYMRFLKNVLTALEKPFTAERGERIVSQTPRAEAAIREALGERRGRNFFESPFEQLITCIELVFESSRTDTVKNYLKTIAVDTVFGTAVTVQQMVFGNLNAESLTGVVFTRNPITGADELFGEYREMTQGEDVVMSNLITRNISGAPDAVRQKLEEYKQILETGLKHELDLEFTVEDGQLYLLQARRATISPYAKLMVDTDLLKKEIIDVDEYLYRLGRLNTSNPNISIPRTGTGVQEWNPPVTTGMTINQGITWGRLVLTREKLEELKEQRESIVLFYQNTRPSDFYIINNSHGIATIYPGRTSHAAITSITLNKPCIVGCSNAKIDLQNLTVTFKGTEKDIVLKEGEPVTLDANSGCLYRGLVQLSGSFLNMRSIAGVVQKLRTRKEILSGVERLIQENIAGLEKETSIRKRTLSHADKKLLSGRKVLVRTDFNVPVINGKPVDPDRIEDSLKTLDYLLEAGATPVVCSHRGDPGAEEKHGRSREELYSDYTLSPAAELLEKLRPGKTFFHKGSVGSSGLLVSRADMVPGKINILENLRFAIGEKENDPGFARNLAALSDDIYVNDAFGACHRSHASITGAARIMKTKMAGFLLEKEIHYLSGMVTAPAHPFIVFAGGAKLSSKFGSIEKMLQKADFMFAGGGVALTLLKAKGTSVGDSEAETRLLELGSVLLKKYGGKIILPSDFMVTNMFSRANGTCGPLSVQTLPLPEKSFAVDIGPESIKTAMQLLDKAETVFWNGPMGINEIPACATGTKKLCLAMAEKAREGKIVIAGGAATVEEIKKTGAGREFTHLSIGSTSCPEYIERLALPGISVLDPE